MQVPSPESVRHISYVLITVIFWAYLIAILLTFVCRNVVKDIVEGYESIRSFRQELRERRLKDVVKQPTTENHIEP